MVTLWMTTEYYFIVKNLDTPKKNHFFSVLSLCTASVKRCSHPGFLYHARSAPSLEDLLTKQPSTMVLLQLPAPQLQEPKRQSKYTGVFFFLSFSEGAFLLSFLYWRSQGNHWSFSEGFGNSVYGICPLKHGWRKALACTGEVLPCLVRPILRSHAKVMLLSQSLRMTAQNQTEDIIKPNSSSYHFILWTKHFPRVSTSLLPSLLPTRSHIVLPLAYKLLHSALALALFINEVLALTCLHPCLTWE